MALVPNCTVLPSNRWKYIPTLPLLKVLFMNAQLAKSRQLTQKEWFRFLGEKKQEKFDARQSSWFILQTPQRLSFTASIPQKSSSQWSLESNFRDSPQRSANTNKKHVNSVSVYAKSISPYCRCSLKGFSVHLSLILICHRNNKAGACPCSGNQVSSVHHFDAILWQSFICPLQQVS